MTPTPTYRPAARFSVIRLHSITLKSPTGAAWLLLNGHPLEETYVGHRGRIVFKFPATAASAFSDYRRALDEVYAHHGASQTEGSPERRR